MKIRFGVTTPGIARVSPQQSFLQQSRKEVRDREDAITNTRDAFATGSKFYRCARDPI